MFKPTYLYIKTHNITRLKYFGKTIQDPFKYKGSGTRWLNHIKKHGYDVTTEILGYFTEEQECKTVAIQFGIDNNIVLSPKWANLKEETIDGGFDHINFFPVEERINVIAFRKKLKDGSISCGGTQHWTDESRKKVKIQALKNLERIKQEIKNGIRSGNPWENFSDEKSKMVKNKISKSVTGDKNGNYGKIWCVKADSQDCSYRKSFLKDFIPEGWISVSDFKDSNKNKTNQAYGKHWYNDGVKNYYLYPSDNKIAALNLEKRRLTINGCCGARKNSAE